MVTLTDEEAKELARFIHDVESNDDAVRTWCLGHGHVNAHQLRVLINALNKLDGLRRNPDDY